eukprot:m.146755 g.146755  ORF g.146755 m.146755 type:complete len:84 (-) comp15038_c0_seq7:57-308(-)
MPQPRSYHLPSLTQLFNPAGLHMATLSNNPDMIGLLVESGADLNQASDLLKVERDNEIKHVTCLHIAMALNYTAAATALLQYA